MTTEDLIKLLDDFPEINPSNYGDDEVNALNAWGIAAHTALEALGREVAELKADLKHTEECCTGWAGDFGKANKELEALRAELAAIRAQEPVGIADGSFNHNCPVGTQLYTRPIPAQDVSALVAALKDAATSLETISRLAGRTHYVGDDGERVETYMGHHDQVRGYATSRASVARNALSKIGGI